MRINFDEIDCYRDDIVKEFPNISQRGADLLAKYVWRVAKRARRDALEEACNLLREDAERFGSISANVFEYAIREISALMEGESDES